METHEIQSYTLPNFDRFHSIASFESEKKKIRNTKISCVQIIHVYYEMSDSDFFDFGNISRNDRRLIWWKFSDLVKPAHPHLWLV